jgi:hypothetical protein
MDNAERRPALDERPLRIDTGASAWANKIVESHMTCRNMLKYDDRRIKPARCTPVGGWMFGRAGLDCGRRALCSGLHQRALYGMLSGFTPWPFFEYRRARSYFCTFP